MFSVKTVAGAIRSVASRSCEVLPVIANIAQILHSDIDLGDRVKRLTTRLEIGIPTKAMSVAEHTGATLSRSDYQRLISAGLYNREAIEKAGDEQLLDCFDGSSIKLEAIRKRAIDRL